MALFRLRCFDPQSKASVNLYYDNQNSSLRYADGTSPIAAKPSAHWPEAQAVSRETPLAKSADVNVLKIQLGLSCNYSCEYCLQRFVPHADDTSASLVPAFVEALQSWFQPPDEGQGRKIEFWGGEPLVYLKTLKPLAEALRQAYPKINFSMITNGSLLTIELVDWLFDMGFGIAISHDGPGQAVRGPDPLDREKTRRAILYAWCRLGPLNRMSFNTMLNRENRSRWAAAQFFRELTGDPDVRIGEGSMVDAYDEGGKSMSLLPEDWVSFANLSWAEVRQTDVAKNFALIRMRVRDWLFSFESLRPGSSIGQRCDMDKETHLAVDLKGNVVTCHNVSVAATAGNGESHKIGHMSDLAGVKLNTSTHWSYRPECAGCPMLQGCKGSCMFLEGELFEISCNNNYYDHAPMFAEAILQATGLVLQSIEGNIRAERQDPFGIAPKHPLIVPAKPELLPHRVETDLADLYLVKDFIAADKCQALVVSAQGSYERSTTRSRSGNRQRLDVRTSSTGRILNAELEASIQQRLASLLGIDVAFAERPEIVSYEPGQVFGKHLDCFVGTLDGTGQRTWTAMIYLDDVEDGGETLFPDIGLRFSPQVGAVLAWNNLLPDGTPNHFTAHEASPIARGQKHVLLQWFRDQEVVR